MIVKTYLSRAQTRAMAIDHPVGDPTGGAAYREMRAPAAAMIGMATSFSGMAAGSIMAGIAFAGSALSLVGSLTGNKTLSTIGLVAGGIGAAGMAGFFGEAVQGATWSSAFGGAAETGGSSLAQAGLSQSAAATVGSQTPVVNGAEAFAVSVPTDAAPMALDAVGTGTVASTAGLSHPGAAGLNAPGTGPALNGAGPAPAPLGQTPGAMNVPGTGVAEGVSQSAQSGGLIDGVMGAGNKITGFVKENPELAKMMAGGLEGLSGYLSGMPDAELAALQAQTGYADARALQIQEEIERERRRRANLNSGYQQVDQRIQVNPVASMAQAQPTGLIAGAQAH